MNDLRIKIGGIICNVIDGNLRNDKASDIIYDLITHREEELLEKIEKAIMSGIGRETGIWHYEINDKNEYDMLKITEVSVYLKSLKQDLTKKGEK